MKSLIFMVGPNAIGKSTAVARYTSKYKEKLIAVSADQCLEIRNGAKARVQGWQGTFEDKSRCVAALRNEYPVVLVESARTDLCRILTHVDQVITPVCSAGSHEANMRARCLAKGKRFRDDYWTLNKLEYEIHRRYDNACARLDPRQVHRVEVSTYADWNEVDIVFGKLFHRLWNSRNKE